MLLLADGVADVAIVDAVADAGAHHNATLVALDAGVVGRAALLLGHSLLFGLALLLLLALGPLAALLALGPLPALLLRLLPLGHHHPLITGLGDGRLPDLDQKTQRAGHGGRQKTFPHTHRSLLRELVPIA